MFKVIAGGNEKYGTKIVHRKDGFKEILTGTPDSSGSGFLFLPGLGKRKLYDKEGGLIRVDRGTWDRTGAYFEGPAIRRDYDSQENLLSVKKGTWGLLGICIAGEVSLTMFSPNKEAIVRGGTWSDFGTGFSGKGKMTVHRQDSTVESVMVGTWNKTGTSLAGKGTWTTFESDGKTATSLSTGIWSEQAAVFTGRGSLLLFEHGKRAQLYEGTWDNGKVTTGEGSMTIFDPTTEEIKASVECTWDANGGMGNIKKQFISPALREEFEGNPA